MITVVMSTTASGTMTMGVKPWPYKWFCGGAGGGSGMMKPGVFSAFCELFGTGRSSVLGGGGTNRGGVISSIGRTREDGWSLDS